MLIIQTKKLSVNVSIIIINRVGIVQANLMNGIGNTVYLKFYRVRIMAPTCYEKFLELKHIFLNLNVLTKCFMSV